MVSGNCFQFDASYHAVMVLLVLEPTVVVLLIPQVPLFEVDIASWQNWSSKLCLLLGAFEPRSLQPRCCALQKCEDAKL